MEGCYGRVIGSDDSSLNQQACSRGGIEAKEGLPTEALRGDYLPIDCEPRIDDGAQAGIGRLHPTLLNLLQEFDERVRLRDGRDGLVKGRLFRIHRQFMEQAPGPRGSPQLPQAPPPPDGDQPSVAPTPNGENCLSSLVVLHFGQAASAEP